MSAEFKDHFSNRAAGYAAARPTYPPALFDWLASIVRRRELVWDCATGNGQAAGGLAAHFARVIATDASPAQIDHARPFPRVEYRVAPADRSGLEPGSVDLVTVAQAMHWIDTASFYAEVRRVAAPGAIVAVWSYALLRVDPVVDPIIDRFERSEVGPYWPPERAMVDAGYRTLDFPFPELVAPSIPMTAEWTLAQFADYLESWSAVDRFKRATGRDPVADVVARLAKVWGGPEVSRHIEWPLHVRVGTV